MSWKWVSITNTKHTKLYMKSTSALFSEKLSKQYYYKGIVRLHSLENSNFRKLSDRKQCEVKDILYLSESNIANSMTNYAILSWLIKAFLLTMKFFTSRAKNLKALKIINMNLCHVRSYPFPHPQLSKHFTFDFFSSFFFFFKPQVYVDSLK